MTTEDWKTSNEISHYKSLLKQDTEQQKEAVQQKQAFPPQTPRPPMKPYDNTRPNIKDRKRNRR